MGWWQGVLLQDHTFLLSSTVALVGVSLCGAVGCMCTECLSKGFTPDALNHAGLCGVLLPKAVVGGCWDGGCWDGGSDGFFLMASSEAELLMSLDLGHALAT